MARIAMQRLLWPEEIDRFGDGSSVLAGVVADLREVIAFTDPSQIIDAHGFADLSPYGPDPEFVDVLRFWSTPLMQFDTDAGTFGFAKTGLGVVPVWRLAATRVPVDSQIWRFHADGTSRLMTRYRGIGRGWDPALAWRPPRQWVGPRAEHQGIDLPASFSADLSEIIAVHEGPITPEGWTETRPRTHEVALGTAMVDSIFALDMTGTADGIALHLIERLGDDYVALVPTDEEARTLGGHTLSPAVHEVRLPIDAVHDIQGVQRIWQLPQLDEPTSTSDDAGRVAAFLQGLEDLPPSPGISIRGCAKDATFARAGQTVVTREITPSTRLFDVATENGQTPALYAILGRSGRDIAAFSSRTQDAEVVFAPGRTFALSHSFELAGHVVHLVHELDASHPEVPVEVDTDLLGGLQNALRDHDRTQGRRADAPPGKFAGDIR